MSFSTPFNVWLRERRQEKGYSIDEFADLMHRSPVTIYGWEHDVRPLRRFCCIIADALGVTEHEVLVAAGYELSDNALPEVVSIRICEKCKAKDVCREMTVLGLPIPCERVTIDEQDAIRRRGLIEVLIEGREISASRLKNRK